MLNTEDQVQGYLFYLYDNKFTLIYKVIGKSKGMFLPPKDKMEHIIFFGVHTKSKKIPICVTVRKANTYYSHYCR